MTETQTASISQIGTVMVPVSDQDRAIEFYCEKLGFEKRSDVPFANDSYRWVEVAPAGAQTTVALVTPQEGEPVGIDTHIAFSTNDIEAEHAGLVARRRRRRRDLSDGRPGAADVLAARPRRQSTADRADQLSCDGRAALACRRGQPPGAHAAAATEMLKAARNGSPGRAHCNCSRLTSALVGAVIGSQQAKLSPAGEYSCEKQ